MRILVVGHARSGTTLLRRIFRRHRNVKRCLHEKFILIKHKKDPYSKRRNWSEKVVYVHKYIYDIWTKKRYEGTTIVDYCSIWNERFGNESRIVHIVRHPYDVLISLFRKIERRRKGNMTDKEKLKIINNYLSIVPDYTEAIMSFDNCISVKYENLILNKDNILPLMFKFCNLPIVADSEGMKVGRVFVYKKVGFDFSRDISNVISVMNKIPGPKYSRKKG